jgi:hypothetical protein
MGNGAHVPPRPSLTLQGDKFFFESGISVRICNDGWMLSEMAMARKIYFQNFYKLLPIKYLTSAE